MKNILVTGGSGLIGRKIAAHLQVAGYTVRVIDTVDLNDVSSEIRHDLGHAEYRQVDVRDYEKVMESCQGMDAVVHMAGIPRYIHSISTDIFHINAGGTFNIYEAAANLGISRIISASSINFLGNGFGKKLLDVSYFPIDEAHAGHTIDPYAFSKQMVEEVGAYFWRMAQISSICFRFPLVYSIQRYTPSMIAEITGKNQAAYQNLMAMPAADRLQVASNLKQRILELRTARTAEKIEYSKIWEFYQNEPNGMLLWGFDNFWSALDVWDAAKAVELALTAEFSGSIPLYIDELENVPGVPSHDLAALFYPQTTTWKKDVLGDASLLDTTSAQELLGFAPTRTFRGQAQSA